MTDLRSNAMNQDRGIEVRCVKCGWEGWTSQAGPERTAVGKHTVTTPARKACPTCGEGPLRAVQVAKVESALHE